ncbi:MAG: hypothetical protein IT385_02180 [Deltaproteobacteria bacterium]|nr:hypothetical protein [Deltaproteobacteria bacterium]
MNLLAGLDAIDWARLRHATGSADDLPPLLRRLVVGPDHERDEALIALYESLVDESLVFSATAPAVPFLVDIARAPWAERRPEVLDLLGRIVRASAFPEVDDPMRPRDEIRDAAETPPAVTWALAAKAAVGRHEASWVELLDDPASAVRAGAAFVLSGLDVLDKRSVALLASHAASEHDDVARAAMLLALAEADALDAPSILAAAMKTGARLIRLASAVAIGRLGFPVELEPSVDLLVSAIREPDVYDGEWSQVAGTESVSSDAREGVVTLAPDMARLAVGPLLGALAIEGCDTYQALRAVLELTFPEQGRPVSADGIGPVQRAVLERLAMTPPVWEDTSDRHVVQRYFRARGLPGTRAELRWFLGA